ncbi:MAG: flavin reductase family protein [Bacteroidetes bacterium]|nr:flavin reductase family protein [Bacteroidota bacterium]
MKQTFDPTVLSHPETHRLLLGGVAPRPIAFVSTMDAAGNVNLAPFSFFNAFGVNPPIVCFSPAFSGKTGAPKHTLLNLLETKECTISIVNYEMVHQASLASAPFERGVDEFVKAGFTKLPSQRVAPPGVAESPFVMEAKLVQHVDFGGKPGSANMLICEVLLMHINTNVINEAGAVDPRLMDHVARMGGPWYTRAAQGLFKLPQPTTIKFGFDELPEDIRTSPFLSGNDLARLLDVETLPTFPPSFDPSSRAERHQRAKELIENDDIESAWNVLLK